VWFVWMLSPVWQFLALLVPNQIYMKPLVTKTWIFLVLTAWWPLMFSIWAEGCCYLA
jgi:hypothetical protein